MSYRDRILAMPEIAKTQTSMPDEFWKGFATACHTAANVHALEADKTIAYLERERTNRDKTLSDIAQALGLEPGDVDGIGAAIEGLRRDAERYRHMEIGELLEKAIDASNAKKKALAAGEAE